MKIELLDFMEYLQKNTSLSETSIKRYESGVRAVSNDMLKFNVIKKPLEEMFISELEIAIFFILNNKDFIKKDTVGKKMYSIALRYFQSFVKSFKDYGADVIEKNIKSDDSIKETEKISIIKSRVGQGVFRDSLIKKYNGKCIISEINDLRLLVASHIKPWAISSNVDRLDVENGLLLNSLYDKLFDLGIITFTNDGIIKYSTTLSQNNKGLLKIDDSKKYNLKISPKMIENLDYHRDCIFLK